MAAGDLAKPVISEPADAQVCDLTPKYQRPFLEGKKRPENPREKGQTTYRAERSHPEPVRVVWQAAGENCTYVLHLSESADMKDAKSIDCGAKCEGAVDNLKLGTDYYLQIEAVRNGEKALSAVRRFRTLYRPPRWIRVPSTSNVRDCGGWPAGQGQRVRQGMIYRGAQINSNKVDPFARETERQPIVSRRVKPGPGKNDKPWLIKPEGVQVMKELGIRSDLDLRHPVLFKLPKPLEPIGAQGLNFQLSSYASFLKSEDPKYPDCFRAFLKEENYPVYIHCMGGADRTGTLVMLLLGVLGVSDEDLLKEYELTTFSTVGSRLRDRPKFVEYLKNLDAFAPGRSLAEKAEAYWKARGITDAEIARFREIMLEPAESK
ncbi:MAG: tyrosine-protein phosphatase [Lentisphaeria bacterium]|nr:tyrosine-protein phosphatase [Lentisphaeria bacterium]